MDEVLFLTYGLKERIWGGDYFKKVMKVTESEEPIGELWSCSGHKAFESVILNGTYKGKTLREVFKEHRELFKNSSLDEFPILIKLIAARDKLSVQVHPSDEYALKNEGQYGKTEGWLILDKKEEYIAYLDKACELKGLKLMAIFITDIVNNGSYVIYSSNAKQIMSLAYDRSDMEEGLYLDGVISRKKQMVPNIMVELENMD